jgi:hypothetical protein
MNNYANCLALGEEHTSVSASPARAWRLIATKGGGAWRLRAGPRWWALFAYLVTSLALTFPVWRTQRLITLALQATP